MFQPIQSPPFKMSLVSCTAPVNMAVIKYWGKRDEKLILPLNDSLSLTLNQENLKSHTSVFISSDLKEDELWLNGKKQDISKERIQNVFVEIHRRATKNQNLLARIVSVNNFPTAAGLASSASGYCCLVFTMAQAYGVQGDLSVIARIGSGSACRSMFGGYAKWIKGEVEDGTDSKAVQVQPEKHWDDVQILVCVVSSKEKETSSTSGMYESAKTSKLLQERLGIVPQRMLEMEQAIKERDFETFANLTMLDSDSFHAVCADTTPKIVYLNNVSNRIITLIHAFNRVSKRVRAAYTYDAGPNACLFCLKKDLPELLSFVNFYFPRDGVKQEEVILGKEFQNFGEKMVNGIQDILKTTVGPGPLIVQDHLMNEKGDIKN